MKALTRGVFLQGEHGAAGEEAHKTQADAVGFFELLFVLAAEGDDFGQVDFVEGGEDGGGVLGFDQAAGDGLAHLGHGGFVDAVLVVGEDGRPGLGGGDGFGRLAGRLARGGGFGLGRLGDRRRRSGNRRGRAGGFDVGQHVFLGDPPARAGGGDVGGVEVVLLDESTHGGAEIVGGDRGRGRRRRGRGRR